MSYIYKLSSLLLLLLSTGSFADQLTVHNDSRGTCYVNINWLSGHGQYAESETAHLEVPGGGSSRTIISVPDKAQITLSVRYDRYVSSLPNKATQAQFNVTEGTEFTVTSIRYNDGDDKTLQILQGNSLGAKNALQIMMIDGHTSLWDILTRVQ